MSNAQIRNDAGESAYLARELELIKPSIYLREYPGLKYAAAMPVSPDKNPAVEIITYRMYDVLGVAKIVASYADDIPRSDIEMREFFVRVRRIATSVGYNIDELLAGMAVGRPIDRSKIDAATDVIWRYIDKLAFLGDGTGANALIGLSNVPNMPNTVVSTVSGATTWDAKLALGTEAGIRAIINDLNAPFTRIRTITKSAEAADAIAMSPTSLAQIAQALMPQTSSTILEYFQKAHPGVAIIESHWLEASGTGGARQMIAYRRDPSRLSLEIPQDLVVMDPQKRNLEEVVILTMKYAGLQARYPLSMDSSYGM